MNQLLRSLPRIHPNVDNEALTRSIFVYVSDPVIDLKSSRNQMVAEQETQILSCLYSQLDHGDNSLSFVPHDMHSISDYVVDDVVLLCEIQKLSKMWGPLPTATSNFEFFTMEEFVKYSLDVCASEVMHHLGKNDDPFCCACVDQHAPTCKMQWFEGGPAFRLHPCSCMPSLESCSVQDLVHWATKVMLWVQGIYGWFIGIRGFPVGFYVKTIQQ